MTPQEIRDAIAASPELQAHAAAGCTQAIADPLSTGYETGQSVEVEAWRLQRYLVKRGRWRGLVAAAENAAHPATLAAQAAVDLATGPEGMLIDLADGSPETAGMLAGLVATGLLTSAQRDEMVSWCQVPRVVTHTEVGEALKGI